MIRALLSNLHGALAAVALVVHTLTVGIFLYLFIILRAVIRLRATRNFFQRALA